jgi:segregation and condensation protein B
MESQELKNIVEAALLANGGPLTVDQLCALFGDRDTPERAEIRETLKALEAEYEGRGIELKQVASGFRIQVRNDISHWLTKLWEERPPRYSRALMETLAIIAYRQPVTRGDVEDIRGVSVTTNIIRTLLERNWIKVVGHRDVPGKPAMFGTTREFLDYFNLKKLDDLPPLAELAELEPVGVQLELDQAEDQGQAPGASPAEAADADMEPAAQGDIDDAGEHDDEGEVDEDHEEFVAADASDAAHPVAADAGDDEHGDTDLAPGQVPPLVGLRGPDEEEPKSATVTSLDAVRARG